MLNKILNIKNDVTTFDKKKVRDGHIYHGARNHENLRDRNEISEAGRYLKQIKWTLNKFNYNGDHVLFGFSASGFRFFTSIYLSELVRSGLITYTVSPSDSGNPAIGIQTYFSGKTNIELDENQEFKVLEKLFDRLESAGFETDVSGDMELYSSYLFDGLENKLKNCFALFNQRVTRFLNIYSGINITLPETNGAGDFTPALVKIEFS